jgi:hypothetical protein
MEIVFFFSFFFLTRKKIKICKGLNLSRVNYITLNMHTQTCAHTNSKYICNSSFYVEMYEIIGFVIGISDLPV